MGDEFQAVTIKWLAEVIGDRDFSDGEEVAVDIRWPDGTITPETMLCKRRFDVQEDVWRTELFIVKDIHGVQVTVPLRHPDLFVRLLP